MADVLILGGGYAGMAAADRLARTGLRSTLIEAEPVLGGHGLCLTIAGAVVERFYHHYKPEDRHILDLIEATGLSPRLRWKRTRMGFYVQGRLYPFSSPLDLVRFRPFSLRDRARFARGVLRAQMTDSRTLEHISAKDWVMREWSPAIYEGMIRQLLVNKFEVAPDAISAAFLHGRIKAVAGTKSRVRGGERLAYLEGGLDALAERFADRVRASTEIRLGTRVDRIERTSGGYTVWCGGAPIHARRIVNTLPANVFERLPKNFEFSNPIAYQGAVCAVFAIREPLTSLYWVNVLDEAIGFRLLVNHSRLGDYDATLVYCSNYVAETDPVLRAEPSAILDGYERDLRTIFGRVTVVDRQLTRSAYATPVFDTAFREKIEYLERFLPDLAFAGNLMVFPGARTVSSVIGTGYRAADRVSAGLLAPAAPVRPGVSRR